MNQILFFILNIFLNSLLVFFTVVFLIEGMIFLFRIRQGRMASTLRMVPILKLPFDIGLYDFSRWSYIQGINPLDCQEGTRTLSVMLGSKSELIDWFFLPVSSTIQLTIPNGLTFTFADLLGYTMNPLILQVFGILFISFSIGIVISRLVLYYRSFSALNSLANSSRPLCRKVHHPFLSSLFKKRRVQILTSPILTGSPFVAGLIFPTVYIPDCLSKNLSKNEYEAILAHEIEHVRFKDGWVRLILDFIETIFWWIPTKWLRKLIEEGQEIGCDSKCSKYGIDPTNLASAICKSAKYSMNTPGYHFAHHLTKQTILGRVNLLLHPVTKRFYKVRFVLACLALGIAFSMILTGRFWMF